MELNGAGPKHQYTMDPILNLVMNILHYLSLAFVTVRAAWVRRFPPIANSDSPTSCYFLESSSESPDAFDRVPEGRVYIEEWVRNDTKRCVVRYAGEEIPKTWTTTPFDTNPKTPWVWVGDRDTEIDLTRTFTRFLVVGNVITMELVEKLIQVTDRTQLIYIETGTFKELKFPGDGITISEYVD